MAQIEFAYNRSPSQTTGHNYFEIVYNKNLISPLDLAPISTSQQFNRDAVERAKQIKHLPKEVHVKINKQNEKYQDMPTSTPNNWNSRKETWFGFIFIRNDSHI